MMYRDDIEMIYRDDIVISFIYIYYLDDIKTPPGKWSIRIATGFSKLLPVSQKCYRFLKIATGFLNIPLYRLSGYMILMYSTVSGVGYTVYGNFN